MTCALLAWGCGDRPASFAEIDLHTAGELAERMTLVEVVASSAAATLPSGPAIVWEVEADAPVAPPDLPRGPVLIVAPSSSVGYRCAAALARSGNLEVRLVIVGNAEDRHTLYARAREREEAHNGTDS